jgi:hypothetical protein
LKSEANKKKKVEKVFGFEDGDAREDGGVRVCFEFEFRR